MLSRNRDIVNNFFIMNKNLLNKSNHTKHSNNYDEFFTDQFNSEYLTIDGDEDDNSFAEKDERCCICISVLDEYFSSVPCFDGYTHVRRSVWEVVSGRSSKYGSVTRYWPSLIFEFTIFILIIVNVILSVLISEKTYYDDADFQATYHSIEIISTIIFTIEYSLRLWTAPSGREKNRSRRSRSRQVDVVLQHGCCSSRLRWFLAPLSMLDLLVLIGFYVDYLATSGAKQSFTAIRLFRLLSIFRFERQSKGLKHLGQVLKRKIPELILALFVAIILLVTSATIMYAVENEYPEFNSLSKALWWSAMTITTVGYGDVSPNTGAGRVIASIVAFMGLCLFALPSAVLGSGLIEVMTEQRHLAFLERKRARRSMRRASRRSYDGTPTRGNQLGRLGGGGGGSGGDGSNSKERKSSSSLFETGRGGRKGGGGGGSENGVEMSKFQARTNRTSATAMRRTMSMDSTDENSSINSGNLSFSDIFDVKNKQHLMAVSLLLMDAPDGHLFFQNYHPEPGGLVGLHAMVTQRLADAYLTEHLDEEMEDDEEEEMGLGGGGGGHYLSPSNTIGEDKFMKL